MAELEQVSIEVPQYHIMADEQQGFLALVVSCSGTMSQHFLCMSGDYRKTASQFREMIMRAGAELNGKVNASKIQVVKELPHGLRPPQGRK